MYTNGTFPSELQMALSPRPLGHIRGNFTHITIMIHIRMFFFIRHKMHPKFVQLQMHGSRRLFGVCCSHRGSPLSEALLHLYPQSPGMMEGVGGVSQTPWNMLTGTCTFFWNMHPGQRFWRRNMRRNFGKRASKHRTKRRKAWEHPQIFLACGGLHCHWRISYPDLRSTTNYSIS